ncbi:hypothetical protein C0J52_02468 [Blattella germanica]|nr:hypothetical protein C0J52_02468 [Blattella germanica]
MKSLFLYIFYFSFSMFGYGSPPKCLKLWKMIYMPLQSLYLDLANGLSSADTMLRSIIRSCDSYKDIFIPKKEGTVDADNYTDFTTWLLGRLFYLMIMKELRPLFDVSVEAQVEILKLLEQNRNVFFNAMCAEYAEVLLDVTNAERLFAQDLQLKRFIPRENDSLAEFIDLTQVRVIVNTSEMRRIFQCQALKTGKEFCTDFDNFIGNLEDVSFGFPFEDSENLFHLLKTHIFQIKASTLTGSELLAAMLFKTMKKLITKWKDGIYPDYVGDAAANVIHILEWAVYEEVATFLAKIGSTFMGTTYAFKGHNVNYERFGDMKNQNLFSIVVQQFFHKSSKKETDSEKLENVDIYDDTMESDEGSSSSHSLSESKNSSGEDSDYIEISSPISETRLPQSPKVQPVYTKSPDNNDYPLADLTSSDEMTEVQPGDSQSPDNNDYPFSDPSRDDDSITMGIPEMANTGGTFTFELAGNSQDSNIMGVPALTSCDDIIKNRVPKLISDLSSTEDEKSSSVEILDEVISPMLETSVRLHRYYKNLKEKHKTEKDQHPLKEANRLVYYHKSLERQMSVVKESPVFKAIRSLSLKSSKPQKPHFSKQVYNVLEVISEEYERCAEQVKSSVENVEKFVKKTDIKPASETTVKDPIPQKRPRKFITLHKTGPHKTVLVDEANEGEPSKKDSVKIAKPHDAHPVAGEGFQESIESKKFHFMMNVKPGTSKDPDPVLQNLDSPDTEDDFQLRMISQDTSEKCINIYCYVASSTWCNLLTRFETNLVALPYAVEATQVNSLLEDIEKIVHCSLELSLMLENNFHELMPWHAYAFILFNKIKVKMAESFSQLFVQLSDEIGQERIISRCLNLVGRLFHLSEVRRASHDDVVTLALFVALPWMDLIEEDRSVGCEIVERCRRNTSLRGG